MQKKASIKKQTPPLKRSTSGFEVEFIIIDKKGKVAAGADEILAKVAKKQGEKAGIVKECAKNMIEVGSYPGDESGNTMTTLLENVRLFSFPADESGYILCPLGTYPGKCTPDLRVDSRYKIQGAVFG